jgi:hypothetical protein
MASMISLRVIISLRDVNGKAKCADVFFDSHTVTGISSHDQPAFLINEKIIEVVGVQFTPGVDFRGENPYCGITSLRVELQCYKIVT